MVQSASASRIVSIGLMMVNFLQKANLIFKWISIHLEIAPSFLHTQVTFSFPTTYTTTTTTG